MESQFTFDHSRDDRATGIAKIDAELAAERRKLDQNHVGDFNGLEFLPSIDNESIAASIEFFNCRHGQKHSIGHFGQLNKPISGVKTSCFLALRVDHN